MARPNKYELFVKPYLDQIKNMALSMTEEQIAESLEIGYSTFCRYKRKHDELRQALKNGRRILVGDLKSKLIEKARGYCYIETKIIEEIDEDGDLIVTKKETNRRYAAPDVAAINLLLKNFDKETWRNDPAAYDLKVKELELRERQIKNNEW